MHFVIYKQLGVGSANHLYRGRLIGDEYHSNTAGLLTYFIDGEPVFNLVIDCGVGVTNALLRTDFFNTETEVALLVTHGHSDHISEITSLGYSWSLRGPTTGRGPLQVFTTEVRPDLEPIVYDANTHGFEKGGFLKYGNWDGRSNLEVGPFHVSPISADRHFPGCANFLISFSVNSKQCDLLVAWDAFDLSHLEMRKNLSFDLAFFDCNTWNNMSAETDHCSVEALANSALLGRLREGGSPCNRPGLNIVHFGYSRCEFSALSYSDLERMLWNRFPRTKNRVKFCRSGDEFIFS